MRRVDLEGENKMRFLLACLAVLTLGFSHGAFAQAPKEVIVVDGQLAVNNGPVNPASVMVENGVTNPVPIIDVTPNQTAVGTPVFGSLTSPDSFFSISVPAGKSLQLKSLSLFVSSHQDVVPYCQINQFRGDSTFFTTHFKPDVGRGTTADFAYVIANEQLHDQPWIDLSFNVTCILQRGSGAAAEFQSSWQFTWTGLLFDAPSQ